MLFECTLYFIPKNGSPFRPNKTTVSGYDVNRYCDKVELLQRQGWIDEADLLEIQQPIMMAAVKRRRELSQPYNPTPEQVGLDRAHKNSGYGQKPWNNKRYTAKVPGETANRTGASAWEPHLSQAPATGVSTKKFPHQQGK